jgi:hypothetical protein
MKAGRIVIYDVYRKNRLRLNKKWFGSRHFKDFEIFKAQIVGPRHKMAHITSQKLEKIIKF